MIGCWDLKHFTLTDVISLPKHLWFHASEVDLHLEFVFLKTKGANRHQVVSHTETSYEIRLNVVDTWWSWNLWSRKYDKLPRQSYIPLPFPGPVCLPAPPRLRSVACYGRFVNELSIGVRAALDIDNCGREAAVVLCFCGGGVDAMVKCYYCCRRFRWCHCHTVVGGQLVVTAICTRPVSHTVGRSGPRSLSPRSLRCVCRDCTVHGYSSACSLLPPLTVSRPPRSIPCTARSERASLELPQYNPINTEHSERGFVTMWWVRLERPAVRATHELERYVTLERFQRQVLDVSKRDI